VEHEQTIWFVLGHPFADMYNGYSRKKFEMIQPTHILLAEEQKQEL